MPPPPLPRAYKLNSLTICTQLDEISIKVSDIPAALFFRDFSSSVDSPVVTLSLPDPSSGSSEFIKNSMRSFMRLKSPLLRYFSQALLLTAFMLHKVMAGNGSCERLLSSRLTRIGRFQNRWDIVTVWNVRKPNATTTNTAQKIRLFLPTK